MKRASFQKKIIAVSGMLTILFLLLVSCNTSQPVTSDASTNGTDGKDAESSQVAMQSNSDPNSSTATSVNTTNSSSTSTTGNTAPATNNQAASPTSPADDTNDQSSLSSNTTSVISEYNGTYYGILASGDWLTLIISNGTGQGFDFSFVESNISGHAEFADDGYAYYNDSAEANEQIQGINFLIGSSGIVVDGGSRYGGLAADYSQTKPLVDTNKSSENGTYSAKLLVGTTETLVISNYSPQGFHFEFSESKVSGDAVFSDDGFAYYTDSSNQGISFEFVNQTVLVETGSHYGLAATYTHL